MNKKISLLLGFAVFLPMAYFVLLDNQANAQQAQQNEKNDAIGIQIRSNPQRYSAIRWYEEEEKFEGSPQVIQVDGYDAIRDGRTVYVNAGNVSNDGKYYANIYLISYSNNAAPGTVDVFSNMLKHWTFNSNMIAATDFGHCNISTMVCATNADCKAGYECRNILSESYKAGKPADNKCHLMPKEEAVLTCWRDKDCPKNIFCDSKKAAVTRRTKRYANLVDIRDRIKDYASTHGYYPKLLSGSYLPGISLSTWPSWNLTLSQDVSGGEFPVDPLNIMGACSSTFNPNTCWNEKDRIFSEGNTPNRMITGPQGSSFYGYYPGNETTVGQVYSFSQDGIFGCPLDGSTCN